MLSKRNVVAAITHVTLPIAATLAALTEDACSFKQVHFWSLPRKHERHLQQRHSPLRPTQHRWWRCPAVSFVCDILAMCMPTAQHRWYLLRTLSLGISSRNNHQPPWNTPDNRSIFFLVSFLSIVLPVFYAGDTAIGSTTSTTSQPNNYKVPQMAPQPSQTLQTCGFTGLRAPCQGCSKN
jgi:hypothetical protein